MEYDAEFDQTRLDQLAQQHLGGTDISGRILFFGDPEENRLDLATWQLNKDEDYETIKGSDFKFQMMELLDTLMTYRAQQGEPNAGQGVVHINGRQLSIEWLPRAYVEELRDK
ncbi:hypothetical protein MLC59_12445 [Marinobacter bryozoorum]|uniref:hypothetical protein n=1 Tax=Marinobacter bryozoorum TaxID=256324 RepID=UPI002005AAEE|nr:hypothetical protein [Marinobacter bryozoorum]MCK7544971.1 hypothetical protein [Marinobacter bryozoorum]